MSKATTVGNGDLNKSLRPKGQVGARGLKDAARQSVSQTPSAPAPAPAGRRTGHKLVDLIHRRL